MGTMRKTQVAEVVEEKKVTSFLASAAQTKGLYGGKANRKKLGSQDKGWQGEAWKYYRTIGEFRFACDWVGSMLSKAKLYAVQVNEDGDLAESKDPRVIGAMERLFVDADGRSEMLRQLGIHFTVAGSCWILGYDDPDPDVADPVWRIAANTVLGDSSPTDDSGSYQIDQEVVPATKRDTLLIRIWKPDPEKPLDAMSPSRPLLPVLNEIRLLTDHVTAQITSRLAGAGILFLPSEIDFSAPDTKDEDGVVIKHANSADTLVQTLTVAMSASIDDRRDPSSLVPIVVTAPASVIKEVSHMKFWSELDSASMEMRREAVGRLATGMDMPPEVLQGVTDSNHWAAWQSDESGIKANTEPLLKIITTSLAEGYLRPALRTLGMSPEEARGVRILADTSDLRTRPNRSKEALELYNIGALSLQALLRETGFDKNDALTEEERAVWFLEKIAGGSATPEMVRAALEKLKIDLPVNEELDDTTMREARPAPSLKDHPTRDIPDREVGEVRRERRQDRAARGLVASADLLVVRALERAGNKLKSRLPGKPTVQAFQLHSVISVNEGDEDFLLDDAWTHVPRVAEAYDLDSEAFTKVLDNYARRMIRSSAPHEVSELDKDISAYLEGIDYGNQD